jgi:hypothetical protein
MWLVVWKIFSHILGLSIPTDFHIFQRGWNHQPDIYIYICILSIIIVITVIINFSRTNSARVLSPNQKAFPYFVCLDLSLVPGWIWPLGPRSCYQVDFFAMSPAEVVVDLASWGYDPGRARNIKKSHPLHRSSQVIPFHMARPGTDWHGHPSDRGNNVAAMDVCGTSGARCR